MFWSPNATRAPLPSTRPQIGLVKINELGIAFIPIPRFQQLRNQALAQRVEAAQLRTKQPHAAGSVEAEDIERLIEVVSRTR